MNSKKNKIDWDKTVYTLLRLCMALIGGVSYFAMGYFSGMLDVIAFIASVGFFYQAMR